MSRRLPERAPVFHPARSAPASRLVSQYRPTVPVVTGAARSSYDPTTAAWCVTIVAQRGAASRFDKGGPAVKKCDVMDRVVEARTGSGLSVKDPRGPKGLQGGTICCGAGA